MSTSRKGLCPPEVSISWISRRSRAFLVVGLAIGVAALAYFPALSEPEPRYRGKPLRQWVMQLGDVSPAPQWLSGVPAPVTAVKHIGTNALPFLVEWIQYRPTALKRELFASASAILVTFRKEVIVDQSRVRAERAVGAFEVLGPVAAPAAGDLGRLAMGPLTRGGASKEAARRVALALGHIGPEGLPYLLRMMTNRQYSARYAVPLAIGLLGTNAAPALPALLRGLEDEDSDVVRGSMQTLSGLHTETETVTRGLAACLRSPSADIRQLAAYHLGEFGPNARNVADVLRRQLSDSEVRVRMSVTNALNRIEPGRTNINANPHR